MSREQMINDGLALIFDMDGVIINSTPLHNESWQIYLRRHGIQLDREPIEAGMLGKHNNDIVRIFFGDGLTEKQVVAHGIEKEKLYRELMRPRVKQYLVPGIIEFLQRHKNVPMGLASNAEPPNVAFIVEEASLRSLFRVIINSQQIEHPKPHPEIYLRSAEMLGVSPRNCVVFEDSSTGVKSARAAGARIVGVSTTSSVLAGVDISIRDFLDPKLNSWLDRIQPID